MDEPTNHLDIKSKNVLKQALKNFEGTLILVSHDRDFLQGLTNKVYEFKDQKIREYLGDIDFYLEQRKVQDFRVIEMKQQQKNEKKAATIPKATVSYQDQKALKSLQNKLSNLEAKISDLEMAILKQDKSLEDNYDKTTSDPSFFNTYQDNKKQLQKFMKEWETVSLEID
jgi:ATP-binding cassette subfamily F protein 3